MKSLFPSVTLTVLVTLSCFSLPATAAEKDGQWVNVPSKWLLSRFVRPSNISAPTYRVAIAVPPASSINSAKPRVAQSCGMSAVDSVAGDFALVTIRNTASLRDLLKSKELYFQLSLTPPGLDINMRSEAARRPIPDGHEFDTPTAPGIFFDANQGEVTNKKGELVVVFPPEGGFASAAIVSLSSGNAAVDRYYLHKAALNWRAGRKSSQNQVIKDSFAVSHPQRWQSVYDH